MGATDVCPFVPISETTIDDCVSYSIQLAKQVGKELNIPVYLYEFSAKNKYKKNLANVRSGEFEGMTEKMKSTKWKPDYGPVQPHKTAGVTAIGARNFLIAYNINLNTKDKKIATDIALDIRHDVQDCLFFLPWHLEGFKRARLAAAPNPHGQLSQINVVRIFHDRAI